VKYDLTPYGIQPDEWNSHKNLLIKFKKQCFTLIW
jgi:hypothetical protein